MAHRRDGQDYRLWQRDTDGCRWGSSMLYFCNIAILAALLLGQPMLALAVTPDEAEALVNSAAAGDAGALGRLKQAAERHDPESLYRLGALVFEGKLVRRDIEQAADLLKRAADKGHAAAQNAYG